MLLSFKLFHQSAAIAILAHLPGFISQGHNTIEILLELFIDGD